jgi:subtilisin family serine protease
MKNQKSILIIVFLSFSFLFILATPRVNLANVPNADDRIRVDREVLSEIQSSGSASYWINFLNEADLSAAYGMEWSDRGWFVYEKLTEVAFASQADVIEYLTINGIPHQPFWIKNAIYVENSGSQTINDLLNFREIKNIEFSREYSLIEPIESKPATRDVIRAIEPNLTRIKADQVWASGIDGSNLIIANIDTGVRYTHETLINQYRGNLGSGSFVHNHNWYDPHRLNPAEFDYYDYPADSNGHGTHVMGTSVGDGGGNQIGVAPGADWIACRGCYTDACYDFALLACGQFMVAPTSVDGTNPDPDSRPHVVNNSWGGGGNYNNWYQQVVDNWHAAGIFPVFANGNSGNYLGFVGNPARYGNVTGVGATTQSTGDLAVFSSWGPTDNPDTINPTLGYEYMKPQVVAPGQGILSAVPWSNSSYEYFSGTSMATPHVTGLVALMWQAGPCLIGNYAVTENLMEHTAWPIELNDGSPGTGLYPNFATGWGEIDALAAIQAARGYCADSSLNGVVTDEISGASIHGASVEISNPGGYNLRHYTNASGVYNNSVEAGAYQLTASKYGYFSKTASGVAVLPGQSVSTNFQLQSRPTISVAGVVYDGGVFGGGVHGHPLSATLSFVASGFSQTINTNSSTGEYQINLYQGVTYNVSISSEGYDTFVGTMIPDSNPYSMDFYLYVTLPACLARGYAYEGGSLLERFEVGYLPSSWANIDYFGNSQVWTFDNPAGWPNFPGHGGFADLNSNYFYNLFGPGQVQVAGLRTRPLNLSDALNMDIFLMFNTDFWLFNPGYETATIRVSRNGGNTWTTVWTEDDDLWFASVMLDLTTFAAGADAFMVEFRYSGTDGGSWQVDDVHITVGECVPVEFSNTEIFLPLVVKDADLNTFNIRPILTAPADGAVLSTLIPTLSWQINSILNPSTWFIYEISTDQNFSNFAGGGWEWADFGSTTLKWNLDPNTTYYWRAAYDYWTGESWEMGPYSEVRNFRTGSGGTILPGPTLVSPANGINPVSLPVMLDWNPVSGAVEYQVRLWFEYEPPYWGYYQFFTTSSQLEIPSYYFDSNTHYIWEVNARNSYAWGNFSDAWEFTTGTVSGTVSINLQDKFDNLFIEIGEDEFIPFREYETQQLDKDR